MKYLEVARHMEGKYYVEVLKYFGRKNKLLGGKQIIVQK
jgi:hypothetical protein